MNEPGKTLRPAVREKETQTIANSRSDGKGRLPPFPPTRCGFHGSSGPGTHLFFRMAVWSAGPSACMTVCSDASFPFVFSFYDFVFLFNLPPRSFQC